MDYGFSYLIYGLCYCYYAVMAKVINFAETYYTDEQAIFEHRDHRGV